MQDGTYSESCETSQRRCTGARESCHTGDCLVGFVAGAARAACATTVEIAQLTQFSVVTRARGVVWRPVHDVSAWNAIQHPAACTVSISAHHCTALIKYPCIRISHASVLLTPTYYHTSLCHSRFQHLLPQSLGCLSSTPCTSLTMILFTSVACITCRTPLS